MVDSGQGSPFRGTVLVAHNFYRSGLPSGENVVVRSEVEQLRRAGVNVFEYFRTSDEIEDYSLIDKASLAVQPIHSQRAASDMARLVDACRPDIVHIHNVYPLISPAIIKVARVRGIPVVQTVHNYRFICTNGLFFRNGTVCEECTGRFGRLNGVRHGCYRGSRAQSTVMALSLTLNGRAWNRVDRFLAVSEFVAERLIMNGVHEDRVTVKPNAIPDPGLPESRGTGMFYAGRLEREKGVGLLMEAWTRSGLDGRVELRIAGDGPLRDDVIRFAEASRSVQYLGLLSPDEVGAVLDSSAVCLVPSLCYEAFPRIVVEAFARGVPCVATNSGAPGRIVADKLGWTSSPTAEGMSRAIREAASATADYRAATRAYYLAELSEAAVLRKQLQVYEDLRINSRAGSS